MTSDRRWLAIDLGTSLGWATRISDKSGTAGIFHGCEKFNKSNRFEGGGMRFLKFARWLDQMRANLVVIDWLCFEEVRGHKGVDAAHVYGGLLAHLTAWCEQHGIPYMGIPVGTIKKHATGSGNAAKALMIAAMVRKGHQLGHDDDDEADALAIIHWMVDYAKTTGAPSLPAKPRKRVALKHHATTNSDRGGPSSNGSSRRRIPLDSA